MEREAREGRHRTRDVGDDENLGLGRVGRLEPQIDRHAARGQAAPYGVAKVDRTTTTTSASTCEANRQFATEGTKRAFELRHLVAIRVQDVKVLGQRLGDGI